MVLLKSAFKIYYYFWRSLLSHQAVPAQHQYATWIDKARWKFNGYTGPNYVINGLFTARGISWLLSWEYSNADAASATVVNFYYLVLSKVADLSPAPCIYKDGDYWKLCCFADAWNIVDCVWMNTPFYGYLNNQIELLDEPREQGWQPPEGKVAAKNYLSSYIINSVATNENVQSIFSN